MQNTIRIDTDLLATQLAALQESESKLEPSVKDGLIEMCQTILNMADEFHQDAPVTFVMLVHEENLNP